MDRASPANSSSPDRFAIDTSRPPSNESSNNQQRNNLFSIDYILSSSSKAATNQSNHHNQADKLVVVDKEEEEDDNDEVSMAAYSDQTRALSLVDQRQQSSKSNNPAATTNNLPIESSPNFIYLMACMLLQQQQQQQQQKQQDYHQARQPLDLARSPMDNLAFLSRLANQHQGNLMAAKRLSMSSIVPAVRTQPYPSNLQRPLIGNHHPRPHGNMAGLSAFSQHQPLLSGNANESIANNRIAPPNQFNSSSFNNHHQLLIKSVASNQSSSNNNLASNTSSQPNSATANLYSDSKNNGRHAITNNHHLTKWQPDPAGEQIGSKSSDNLKPAHSYIGLIAMCILSTPEKRMVLNDIYQFILDNYPYYRNRGSGWRNSVRHNLSLNECFQKSGRAANGKGHYWTIHPANMEDFMIGDFRRRRAQRKVRRWNKMDVPSDESDDESEDATKPPLPQHFIRSLEMHRRLGLRYQKTAAEAALVAVAAAAAASSQSQPFLSGT